MPLLELESRKKPIPPLALVEFSSMPEKIRRFAGGEELSLKMPKNAPVVGSKVSTGFSALEG